MKAEPQGPRRSRRALIGAALTAVALAGVTWWSARSGPERAPASPPPERAASSRPWTQGWVSTLPDGFAPPAAPAGAPNLVLVMGCTVRRDQLTPYGGPDTTPFLARLAREGARFADAIAAAPWTKAASIAILTGRHPVSIGMVEPESRRNHRVLPANVPTLAERLAAAGWDTVGATTNPTLNATFGISRGFRSWHDSIGRIRDVAESWSGVDVVTALLEQVPPREAARPLYLQVMLTDAHAPRRVRPELLERFAGAPKQMTAYRGALFQLDEAIAALDAGLSRRGYTPADTLFVFIADHGEGLFSPRHHLGSHGRVLYPSSVLAPWILRGPGVRAGQVVGGLASQADVVPTLLDLLGQPAAAELTGMDHAARLRGQAPESGLERAYSDTWFQEVNRSSIWTDDRQCQKDFGSERTRTWIPDGCFDRRADPDFSTPIEDPALMSELEAWRAARESELAAWGRVEESEPDAETLEQLRALGYAD